MHNNNNNLYISWKYRKTKARRYIIKQILPYFFQYLSNPTCLFVFSLNKLFILLQSVNQGYLPYLPVNFSPKIVLRLPLTQWVLTEPKFQIKGDRNQLNLSTETIECTNFFDEWWTELIGLQLKTVSVSVVHTQGEHEWQSLHLLDVCPALCSATSSASSYLFIVIHSCVVWVRCSGTIQSTGQLHFRSAKVFIDHRKPLKLISQAKQVYHGNYVF